ncbi:MAG TPA: ABC transporter ATP-binding protein [Elainellaceae cyanobacterium]
MGDRIVSLSQVSKIYPTSAGEIFAVRDINLDIRAGEFFSLLGSSGSGKTTTLRLIGGFAIPEYGTVLIGNDDVTTLPPYRRNVHTVFQSYALFPHLTVAQNIAYPLTIAKMPRAEIESNVTDALKMFQIEQLGDRRPAQLSGGQQQRVALARALISRPKVLLLDEPLSALDAKIRDEVRQELRELQQKTNLTFIYVTHDQEEALSVSDRIAVMHNGRIEQIGTPTDIYNYPASLFVAQFIGKATFLRGTLLDIQPDSVIVDVKGHLIKAASLSQSGMSQSVVPGSAVTLMIRPERIQVNPPADTVNQFSGTPSRMTYIGQRFELDVETAVGRLMVTQLSGQDISYHEQTFGWNQNDCILIPFDAGQIE